jgi:hypothetical protein
MSAKLSVQQVDDFEVTGDGTAPAWAKESWQSLQALRGSGPGAYTTRAKVLYSSKGLYFLVDCDDRKLCCSGLPDGADLWKEDVVEVFLWPDQSQDYYFEYEISPLGAQLLLLVPNNRGNFHGWQVWHHEGERLMRAKTAVRGGEKAAQAAVSGWSAEFFVPFALLRGFGNVPASATSVWRANMYRIDYDTPKPCQWAWEDRIQGNFHDFRNFGTFRFV